MKRAAERENSAENGKETGKFRRQNPVSCQFCRSKKLRCDRAQPCANCSARRISCVPASASVERPTQARAQAQAQSPLAHDKQSYASSIESRLKALEQVVFHKSSGQDPSQTPEAVQDGTISKTVTWIEADAGTVHGPVYSPYLEDHSSPLQSSPAKDWTDVLAMTPTGPHPPLSASEIAITLPNKVTAQLLFDRYVKNLNWVYHIIHVPTTREQLLGIYASLEAGRKPTSSHLALIATILAVAVYFRTNLRDAGAARDHEMGSCTRWSLLAQKALLEANHLTSPSLESLQTTIIMTQFLPNYGQNTSFIATLTHTAHMLQLHKVDSVRNRKLREETGYDAVELEVKRRIWWYIAGTDWLLSFMSGPQCGTYVCNPSQMNVLPPSNLDDEDLAPARACSQPLSEPTEMTYSIGKIELAQAIRELVDEASQAGLEVEEMSYEQILAFDKKFTELLNGLPWFYSMDEASRRKSAPLERERPYIAWQRNFIHFGFHTRLSRLHRPYLARGHNDPRYAYSRMICLRSARKVIEMEQQMRQPARGVNPDSARLWIVVHHVFVATVTLVMDYVCHKDDPQAAQRKAEIRTCYSTLETNREHSAIARRGLARLKRVMQDWMAKSDCWSDARGARTRAMEPPSPPAAARRDTANTHVPLSQAANVASFPPPDDRIPEAPACPDHASWMGVDLVRDLWQDPFDFNGMINDDPPQWDLLFRDLESQPGIYG